MQMTRAEVAAEVEFFLDLGESRHQIARALGRTPEGISRTLREGGRHDLAKRYAPRQKPMFTAAERERILAA